VHANSRVHSQDGTTDLCDVSY